MQKIKKIFVSVFIFLTLFTLNFGLCLKTGPIQKSFEGDSSPIMNNEEVADINEGPKTFTDKLNGIINLPQKDAYTSSLGYVIALIQIAINRLLGILAFIALIYIVYCGILVFSSGSDDKNAAKGKKGISTAAIALAGIGISWLIISAIMWFISLITSTD